MLKNVPMNFNLALSAKHNFLEEYFEQILIKEKSLSEQKYTREEKNENYTQREFCYQTFQRSFTVPENNVASDKITANYSDGILNITLPKREEVKPRPAREIKIS